MDGAGRDGVILHMPGVSISTRQVRCKACAFPTDALQDVRVEKSPGRPNWPQSPMLLALAFVCFAGGFAVYTFSTGAMSYGENVYPIGLLLSGALCVCSLLLFLASIIALLFESFARDVWGLTAVTSLGEFAVYRSRNKETIERVAKALRQVMAQSEESVGKVPEETGQTAVATSASANAPEWESPRLHSRTLKGLAIGVGGVLMLVFAFAVWPTPFIYSTMGSQNLPIRIHRLTGQIEKVSTLYGWTPLNPKIRSLPRRHWRALYFSNGKIDHIGLSGGLWRYLSIDVDNGAPYVIKSALLEVTVLEKNRPVAVQPYEITGEIGPYKSGTLTITASKPILWEGEQTWSYVVLDVKGYKP